MKLPYDAALLGDSHNIALVKQRFPKLGLVLDLQNQVEGIFVLKKEEEEKRLPRIIP